MHFLATCKAQLALPGRRHRRRTSSLRWGTQADSKRRHLGSNMEHEHNSSRCWGARSERRRCAPSLRHSAADLRNAPIFAPCDGADGPELEEGKPLRNLHLAEPGLVKW